LGESKDMILSKLFRYFPVNIFKKLYDLYNQGENISIFLKENADILNQYELSSSDAVALTYDLQAGSYVRGFYNNTANLEGIIKFIISKLRSTGLLSNLKHLGRNPMICDFGTGEATNYTSLINLLANEHDLDINPYGMDISLSRIDVARHFAAIESKGIIPKFFIGDLKKIPLLDDSIDLSFTMHAIEPNLGSEEQILNEIIRVSRDYIVLHEPIYETAPDEQKKRMEKFGYIQTLRSSIHESNGVEIIEESLFPEGLGNSVNRATLFILRKKDKVSSPQREESGIYACPLVGSKLIEQNGYWLSLDGLCYPEINGIPILREKYALPYYQQAKFLKT